MNRKKIHLLSNTHWDREHRHGFQQTRLMLVELIDKLIDIMDHNPDYRYFTLDGQAVIIEDYLEVRPHMKTKISELIKQGRILIGPWYSLVDCYAVQPESIIRNLLIGDRVCKEFGPKMDIGYSIFSFGQISQLPQVYGGFGINNIIFYKGYSKEVFKNSEFIWRAPDGTEALTSRLGKDGRWNFFFSFTIPVVLGGDARKPGFKAKFKDGTKLCHLIDSKFVNKHFLTEIEPDIRIREDKVCQGISDVIDSVSESLSERLVLAFDGTDFTYPFEEVIKALEKVAELCDDVEIEHSNAVEYFKELREDIDLNKLYIYQGEMRFGPIDKIHAEVLGTNVILKQRCYQTETTMLYYTEPFSAFSAVFGGRYRRDELRLAWKYILKAQAHDSIHGTGVPKITSDTLYRLEQAQEIADNIAMNAFEGIISNIQTEGANDDDIFITVFNPLSRERSEVIEVELNLPDNVSNFWFEDFDSNRLEHHEYGRKERTLAVINKGSRPKGLYGELAKTDVYVKDIPALGYKTFKLRYRKKDSTASKSPFPKPVFPYSPIGKIPNILDNGLVKVEINPNGTINIHDCETGAAYKDIHFFADTGCSGNMWVHREPPYNKTLSSTGCQAQISIIKNSGLSATMRIEIVLDIPTGLSDNRMARDKNTIPTRISTDITLSKGSKRIDFKTNLGNCSRDHMLTVNFPTGLKIQEYSADCPFEIVRRKINYLSNKDGIRGDELVRHPLQDFVDMSDSQKGIAVFTKGLREYEISQNNGAVLSLTLLRAVTQTFPVHNDVFVSFEDEVSQCLGNHSFEYAIYPHEGDYIKGDVISKAREYAMPLVCSQFSQGKKGNLPYEMSFLTLSDARTKISCIKYSEDDDHLIVRLYNPTDDDINEQLQIFAKMKKVYLTDMNENVLKETPVTNDKILELHLKPYKIVTLRMEIDK